MDLGILYAPCVLWDPGVSWRSEDLVASYTANIARGLDGCGQAANFVAKTNAPNRMRNSSLAALRKFHN
jgi:hypothetical protein